MHTSTCTYPATMVYVIYVSVYVAGEAVPSAVA